MVACLTKAVLLNTSAADVQLAADHSQINCMLLLTQDIADQYLRDRQLTPVLQAVIGGKFAQQIICKGLPYRSEKEEEFYQVLQPLDTQVATSVL